MTNGVVANTLRLRLALRVSNADPELAKEQAKLALGDIAGLMKSNDDNLKQTLNANILREVMKISMLCCLAGERMWC